MSRRILSVVVTVLGLVLIALAVCSATIWKPSSKVEATLASGPSQPYVMTAPGVLSSAASDVTVTAKSSDGKDVQLFIARAADASDWLSPDAERALPYTVVTGVDADAGTLASKDETQYCPPADATPAASAAASSQPSAKAGAAQCSPRKVSEANAASSDIWLGKKTGGSSVTFNTADSADRALLPRKNLDDQVVVLAMTDGKAQAPTLTMSWSRDVETPWYFYGGLVLGGLFVLAGVFLFFIDLQLRRADVERRTLSAERAARIANADSVSTEGIPQVDDPDRQLTRRELRAKERAEASGEPWTDPRTGRVYLDGVEAPAVPQAPETPSADGYYGQGLPEGVNGFSEGTDGGFTGGFGDGFSGGPGGGLSGEPGGYAENGLNQQGPLEDQADAGIARGSSVVPGLDEAATQQYRAARELGGLDGAESGEALTIASEDAGASAEPGLTAAPGFTEASAHTSHAIHHSHVASSAQPESEGPEEAQDHSRFAPKEHHTSHVAGEPGAQPVFEGDTAEIAGMTPSAPQQDPSLQMPTSFAEPEAQVWPAVEQPQPQGQSWPAADQPEVTNLAQRPSTSQVDQVQEPTFSGPEPESLSDAVEAPTTATTVSWPSYSDGVELPPAADPAVIQAADAEPLGEPDPNADPDNQEHA